jgi:hypothetical protein
MLHSTRIEANSDAAAREQLTVNCLPIACPQLTDGIGHDWQTPGGVLQVDTTPTLTPLGPRSVASQ